MYVALHVHLASGTCSVTLFSEALARELKAAAPETFPSRLLARRGLACRCEPRPAGGHGKGICNVKEGTHRPGAAQAQAFRGGAVFRSAAASPRAQPAGDLADPERSGYSVVPSNPQGEPRGLARGVSPRFRKGSKQLGLPFGFFAKTAWFGWNEVDTGY
ncbi:unnamed protein product [Effrenium voratum]|nr:unnamed protein product [Effrenium voratum]